MVATLKLREAEHGLLQNLQSFRFYQGPLWAEQTPNDDGDSDLEFVEAGL